ncbi:MAG: hypothetical protein FWF07_03180 [Methanomassiliicoccaceae archaeon]|nr:hypothetical protein [Methanomassiliicoccaceae archaeon]
MRTDPKNNSEKKGNKLFGKYPFLIYGLLVLVAVIVVAAAVLTAPGGTENPSTPGLWNGAGTVSTPYQIGSAEDLAELAYDVNTNGNTHAGDWFVLTADIDLNVAPYDTDLGWTPIGNNTSNFYGNFDGDGHTISNLFINATTGSNIGLFGQVANGIIENLGVVNANITGYMYAGGVVGTIDHGTVENCYVTGTVTGTLCIGGVVGSSSYGTIENCYNTGDVTQTYSEDFDNQTAGGVVGNSNYGTVTNCYNIGNVVGGGNYIGGVAGWALIGTVKNCYNTGNVTGGSYYVGGVVGAIGSDGIVGCTVTNCYNTGDVAGVDYVGGLLGANDMGTVTNCYNTGDVVGDGDAVGGVVGNSNDFTTVLSCFFLQSQVSGGVNYGLSGIGYDFSHHGATNEGTMTFEEGVPASTFIDAAGWDFDNVWGIYLNNSDPGKPGYGLPYIKTIGNNVLIIPDGGSKVFDGSPAPAPTWSSNDPFDMSLFTGSLSYDPTPAVGINTYNITIGTLEGPLYQLRLKDDVQFEIKEASPEPPTPGVSYTITASSDANSTISPSGKVSVQEGTNKTFTYSAASGHHISSVTVNGNDLAQGQITGSFTFTNVMSDNTIAVKSSPDPSITLTITIAQGSGYAEYSVNGSDFVRYVSAVPLSLSDVVTVRANADDGYSFVKWETPSVETASEVTLTVESSLSLKAYFSENAISPGSSHSCLCIWILVIIIVLIIIGVIAWYLFKRKKRGEEQQEHPAEQDR